MRRSEGRLLAAAALFLTLLVAPAPSLAREYGEPEHGGLLISIQPGLGFVSAHSRYSGDSASIEGAGGLLSLTVGGALSPTFVLGASCWVSSTSSPTFTFNGVSNSPSDSSLSLAGCGPTALFWIMPANVYLSLTPSLTGLGLDQQGDSTSSRTGVGLQFLVGKEWWVGDHWGIGFAGVLQLSRNRDTGFDAPLWRSAFVGLAASFTRS